MPEKSRDGRKVRNPLGIAEQGRLFGIENIDWPKPDEGDEDDDPPYDSTRDYLDQIDRYKEFQDKPTERQPRSDIGGTRAKQKPKNQKRRAA
jgi:hypothetical protein